MLFEEGGSFLEDVRLGERMREVGVGCGGLVEVGWVGLRWACHLTYWLSHLVEIEPVRDFEWGG